MESAITNSSTVGSNFSVIGIGASAGGLKSFERFFDHMPPENGLAFVLIQHIDPARESLLIELLERHTQMKVCKAENGMTAQPDHVYVVPPNRDLAFLQGAFYLMEPTVRAGLRMPIDYFFRSLAEEQGERAIGIVLSGTGSDGTLGLKSIKGAGGMVMVQEPASAEYPGMPGNAINTGLVDYILLPEDMPKHLLNYVRSLAVQDTPPVTSYQNIRQKIIVLLRTHTGHDFAGYKKGTLDRQLKKRMAVNQIQAGDEYVRYLQQSSFEVNALFKELLIGVTQFFREPEATMVLKQKIIPYLLDRKVDDETLRIWVPGCSTGEEPYSLAMLLKESLDERNQKTKIQIFATDIDEDAVEYARRGEYPENIYADIPGERLRRFFLQRTNVYQIQQAIRETVLFSVQNVLKDPPFSHLDMVSCRNLLIYLEREWQEKVLAIFSYSLNPGGILFLGKSENIGALTDKFAIFDKDWKVYQSQEQSLHFVSPDTAFEVYPRKSGEQAASPQESKKFDIGTLTKRMLLENYAPACAVINRYGEILYVSGRTGNYLEPAQGEVTTNIEQMAREGLKIDLGTAIRKAQTKKQQVIHPHVRVKTNGGYQMIRLVVTPVPESELSQGLLMIVFEPISDEERQAEPVNVEPEEADSQQVASLKRELAATKEYLQTTVEDLQAANEELKSTNEELQSANEELQSTNEELGTSKEELQSANEELLTLNMELQEKVQELFHASNDMHNLLTGTLAGAIFLDIYLHIKRFTSTVTQVLPLSQHDIGRPMADFISSLEYDRLLADTESVLNTLIPRETDIRLAPDRWYHLRIIPYRTTNNVIEGVAMIFVDITTLKRTQDSLRRMSSVFMEGTVPILIEDFDGRIVEVNEEVVRTYGWTREELLGQPGTTLVPSEHHVEIAAFHERCKQGERLRNIESWRRKKSGERFPVLLTLSLLTDENNKPVGIATFSKNISEFKQAQTALQEENQVLEVQHAYLEILLTRSDKLLAMCAGWIEKASRMESERQALQEMCEMLVNTVGYRLVWTGLLRSETPVAIEPVAYTGISQEEAERLERGLGPAKTSIFEGQCMVMCHIQTDPAYALWRHEAAALGYEAAAFLPIEEQGRVRGIVAIYAGEPDAFGEHETKLLDTVSKFLVYGLRTFQE